MKTITLTLDDDGWDCSGDDRWRVNINSKTYIDGEPLPDSSADVIRNLEWRLKCKEEECQRLPKALEDKERERQRAIDWGSSQAKQLWELRVMSAGW
jgi:hypothetical protein